MAPGSGSILVTHDPRDVISQEDFGLCAFNQKYKFCLSLVTALLLKKNWPDQEDSEIILRKKT